MELKIYNQSGVLKLTVSTSSSSTWNNELMTENAVSASWVYPEYVPLDVNDYVMLEGVKFSIKKEYKPKQKDTQTYSYSVKFYAPIHDAQQVVYLHLTDGQYEPQFSLDGNLREHLQKWVDNMNRIYGSAVWSIGDVVVADNQTIEYNNVTCWDALTSISEAFGTEWWADGFVMNLSRCECGEQVELGYMQGLTSLTQSENSNDVKFFTRLIPLGSTKNIDASRYGFSRLQLPDKAKYVDRNTHYGLYEHVEEAAFAEIFPHYTGIITSVRSEEKTGEDKKPFTVYLFKDSGMTFDPCANEIGGLVKHVSFQTGDLAGRDFEANYNSTTKEWEIINTYPSDDVQIPGGNLIPAIGNKYIPWNFRMPESYEKQAELDYKAAVDDFLTKYSDDVSKYGGDTDYIYIDKNKVSLSLGQRVRLLSDKYFSASDGYRDTRLTKVVRKLDNLSIANIECTNQVGKGWKSQVDSSLSQLKYVVDEKKETILDILKTWDAKEPSNYSVFSSLRSRAEHLSRKYPDEAADIITFLKGLLIGKNGSSFTSLQDGTSQLVVDRLYVKIKAIFDELEVKKKTYVGGEQILSPAGMKCIRVEERTDAYRCYLKVEEDGVETEHEFTPGTLAISQECNIKVGVSHHVGNRYYWRLVTAVGPDYIDLSKTECDPNVENDIPAAGDDIVALGHNTDITRQGAIVLSSVNEVAPSILMYQGINDFTLTGKEVTGFDFDKVSGKARMRVYGDTYIGDKEGKSYMKYDPETGLEIKGQLAVGSKIGDGRTIEDVFKGVEDGIVGAQKEAANAANVASEASSAAVDATRTANSAAGVATNAKNRLDSWAADGVISPVEKQGIKDEIVRIDADKTDVSNGYSKYTLGAADAYKRAHTAYRAALVTLSSTEVENIPISTDFAVKQSAYYTERTTALAVISTAAKKVADDAAKAAEEAKKSAADALTAIAGYDYLKKALKGGTVFQGGLGLTSTMLFGQEVDNTFVVKSGVNGIFDATKPGGGISSWAGGPMKDLAEDYPLPWASTPQPANPELYANSVTRMDGTGYDVGGNFWKSVDGKIHCDPLSFFVGEEKVGDILSLFTPVRRNNTLVGTLQNVPFEDGYGKGLVKFGKHTLREDSDGNVLFEKSDGTPVNLLVTGGVTMHALGSRTAATIMDGVLVDGTTIVKQDGKLVVVGGGGSSVDMTTVWTALAANTSEQINVSHIPNLSWGKITSGKPTTLGGYGITDGVLTSDTRLTNARPASDVSAWAKASTKPSYAFNEITSKPTTLSGYGITNALPLTGGTVTGALYAPNFAANVDGVHAQKILYLPNSTYSVGATTRPRFGRFDRADGSVVLQLGNGNVFDIVDSNWGRTVARFQNANIPLIITSTNTGQSMINFCADSDGLVGQVGWHNGLGSFLYNNNSNISTLCVGRVTDINRAIEYRHAGSTFYALYGEHNTALAKTNIFNFRSAINLLSLDQNKWYPCWVSVNVQTVTPTRIVIHNALSGNKPTWATHASGFSLHVDMEFIPSGWGSMTTYVNCLNYEALYGGETAFGGTEQNTSASDQIVWLRGGGYYYYWVSTGQTFNVGTTGYSWVSGAHNYKRDVRTTQGDATSGFKGWRSAFNSSNIASSMPYLHFKNYNDNGNAGYVGRSASSHNTIYLSSYNNNPITIDAGTNYVQINNTLNVIPKVSGNFNEGIRLYGTAKDSTWSNINFGCDPSTNNGSHVNQWLLGRSSNNSFVLSRNNLDGANGFVVTTAGNMGIGVPNPTYRLTVDGTILATNILATLQSYSCVQIGGGYYSNWNTSGADTWVNVLEPTRAIFNSNYIAVAANTTRNIIGWSDAINGVGYATRYSITSGRAASGWGAMKLSVGNSDAGNSGHQFSLSGNGGAYWTGSMQTNGIYTSVSNGITSTFGALNGSYCHIYTTAPLFYMDKGLSLAGLNCRESITVAGNASIAGSVAAGRIYTSDYNNASYSISTGSFICASWIRTTGATGWYNETYGGGIYQADADQVRVYNNKVFYNEGYRVWGVAGHNVGLKLYQASHIGINLANNSYTWGIYSNNNGNLYFGRRNGNVNDTSGSYYYVFGAGLLSITGNLLLSGGSTMHGSDITKKNVLSRFVLPLNQIANAPLIRYRWKDNRNNRINVGGSAQYTNSLLPECAYKVGDTWSMDYETTAYAFAVSTAKHFLDYINEQATKEDARDIEIRDLKQRIEILERRTA